MLKKNNTQILKWPLRFIFYLIIFNIAFDFSSVFYGQRGGTLAILRGLFMVALIILPSIGKLRRNPLTVSVLAFVIYLLFLLPFVSDFEYSFNKSLKVSITLLMLPIGYRFFDNYANFSKLNSMLFWAYLVMIMGFVVSNMFDLQFDNFNAYSTELDFSTGGMSDNWNNITYLLLLAPLFFRGYETRLKKNIFAIFGLVLFVILIISFKRIAIAGLILGYMFFAYKYGNFSKVLKNFLIVSMFIAIVSPLFVNVLYLQYVARQDKFQKGSLEKETRYKESFFVWEETMSFEDPLKSIFGMEAFNSIGNYAEGTLGQRTLHVDYNLIVNTTGLVGLLLYLNIYFQLYKVFKSYTLTTRNDFAKMLESLFLTIFFTSLFTSFAGQMMTLTFRITIFLYLGAILGMLKTYQNSIIGISKVN